VKLTSTLIVVLASLLSVSSWAASVSAVKGQKTLINLEGSEANPGDEFFLINPANGKKNAIVRITQVKNGKAIAEIVKGRAAQGFTLQAKASGSSAGGSAAAAHASSDVSSYENTGSTYKGRGGDYLMIPKDSWGIVGEYLMNTMDATHTVGGSVTATANMKNSSFGAGGFYDYVYTPELIARGGVALEQFSVKGASDVAGDCSGSDCKADITYLTMSALGKYNFNIGKYRPWVGAGGGFMIAVSKSSNILKESEISTNQVLTAAFGVDIQMSRKNYIPVSLEYSTFFPPAELVKAHMIILKGGWAWNL
jgi:hypothetical protein